MNCNTYRELVAADVDGNLRGEELRLARAHTDRCAACARIRDLQAAARDIVRERAPLHGAPPGFRDCIAVAVDEAEAPAGAGRTAEVTPLRVSPVRSRLVLFGSIAALLLIAILPLSRLRGPDLLATVLHDVQAAEAQELPLALRTSSIEDLRRYYHDSGRIDFDDTVDDLDRFGLHPVGGSVAAVGGVDTTLTLYQGGAHKVLCRHFRAGALRLPPGGRQVGDAWIYTVGGVTVRIHRSGDVVCCLATTMPPEDLLRLLSGGGPVQEG